MILRHIRFNNFIIFKKIVNISWLPGLLYSVVGLFHCTPQTPVRCFLHPLASSKEKYESVLSPISTHVGYYLSYFLEISIMYELKILSNTYRIYIDKT